MAVFPAGGHVGNYLFLNSWWPNVARLTSALAVAVLLAGCSAPASLDADGSVTMPTSNEIAFLWSSPFPALAIEFYLAPDLAPSPLAQEALVEAMENLTLKEVVSVETIPLTGWAAERRAWTAEDLTRLALEHSKHGLSLGEYGADGSAILHVYYLQGYHQSPLGTTRGAGAEGRAYLFFDQPTSARPLVQEKSERHTLLHEAGHAIGLVNCGLPMVTPREDPESRCHSTNTESVMAGGEVTLWPPDPMRVPEDRVFVHTFDENDMADVRAFQAKEPGAPPSKPSAG